MSIISKPVIWLIILCACGAAWAFRIELVNFLRILGHTLAWAGIGTVLVLFLSVTLFAVRWLSKRGLKRLAFFSGVFCLLVNSYLLLNVAAALICDPDIDKALQKMPPPGQRIIYARRGENYKRLPLPVDRRISGDELRDSALILAVPPIEDERLWTRVTGPLDPEAILRGAIQTLVLRNKQGGSTILVQTAKLIQGKLKSSWLDKPYQFLMALRLFQRFPSGEEQLAFYLNLADLDGPYGVAYAAADFFGVADLRDLKATDPDAIMASATLAGMLKAPNDYHPRLHPREARERRNVVLTKMHEVGVLENFAALQARPLKVLQLARYKDLIFFGRVTKGRNV
jgi:membrane peptidoglycan carboxypeptidase